MILRPKPNFYDSSFFYYGLKKWQDSSSETQLLMILQTCDMVKLIHLILHQVKCCHQVSNLFNRTATKLGLVRLVRSRSAVIKKILLTIVPCPSAVWTTFSFHNFAQNCTRIIFDTFVQCQLCPELHQDQLRHLVQCKLRPELHQDQLRHLLYSVNFAQNCTRINSDTFYSANFDQNCTIAISVVC